MASAELTVAKAALTGALFRADPRPCSRDEIESMLVLLNTTITECSPPNVQKFKHWALSNLVPSSSRIPPFCKYLVALTGSFGGDGDKTRSISTSRGLRVPSAKRRRLHVLYIVNDILYHAKFRTHDESFAEKLAPTLPALFKTASSSSNSPKHMRKIRDLITLWEENGYFNAGLVEKLQSAVDGVPSPGDSAELDSQAVNNASSMVKAAKSAPFIMPAMHGDPSAPWYDLPAANWLPVLEPNSTRPMNPAMIKPLVLAGGPADKSLVEAVKKLLSDVEKIYSKEANLNESYPDINQMGEAIEVDEITGEIIGGETYYGWSRAFCEKMKARKRGRHSNRGRTQSTRSPRSYSRSLSRSRTPRRSQSRSPTPTAFKRPRLPASPRDRSRSRSGGRNWSRSRSPRPSRDESGHRGRHHQRSRSHSRARPQSRSRSRSPGQRYEPRSPSYGHSGSRSRSPGSPRGYSPSSISTGLPARPALGGVFMPGHPQPPHPIHYPAPPLIPHQAGFGHMPVPPPPPPNYHGQWPPPPPIPGPPPQSFYPGAPPPPPAFTAGGWVPPPPPPPHPPQQQFQPTQGGGGGYRGMPGGRGFGYGRGGGRW